MLWTNKNKIYSFNTETQALHTLSLTASFSAYSCNTSRNSSTDDICCAEAPAAVRTAPIFVINLFCDIIWVKRMLGRTQK